MKAENKHVSLNSFQHRQRGFTLIELLVVVLIIGILAAIALPQYQKAVKRARIVEYEVNLKTFAEAEHAYYLEHGEYTGYTDDNSKLDIGMPECKLLPGLNSMVKSCTYKLYATESYQTSAILNINASSFPLGAIFLLPLEETFNGVTATLKPGTLYCNSLMGVNCPELGFTEQVTSGGHTFYHRP